jgi:hypothetical protein
MNRTLLTLTLLAVPSPPLRADDVLTARELAAKIDEHIAARWEGRAVTPAPVADDAEFVRRLHLDLHGRIPDILAARDFAENPAKDKREKLVARLLGEERYAVHWANVWRAWLLPESADPQGFGEAQSFERWLSGRLRKNTPYSELVRDLLVANQLAHSTAARSFLAAREFKPEEVAAAVSRLFLGVKLECARCHNHPFASWKKQQFWELAAFFGPLATPGQIKVPMATKTVRARFLDGKPANPLGDAKADVRNELADWMAARDNPYFARAAVNRVWEYLLGTGLIEPLDEEGPDNPPSHPDLLDLLAKQFIAHQFDLKYLLQAITLSRAYQRTTAQSHPSQDDPRLFARAQLRGLSPEQLYDSLIVAAGREDEPERVAPARSPFELNSPRAEFARRFPAPNKRSLQETSILQALFLMNGEVVQEAVSVAKNRNLTVLALGKIGSTARCVERLFLIALSRKPTARESARLVKYLDRGGPSGDRAKALEDAFWALLNSTEFCLNH